MAPIMRARRAPASGRGGPPLNQPVMPHTSRASGDGVRPDGGTLDAVNNVAADVDRLGQQLSAGADVLGWVARQEPVDCGVERLDRECARVADQSVPPLLLVGVSPT